MERHPSWSEGIMARGIAIGGPILTAGTGGKPRTAGAPGRAKRLREPVPLTCPGMRRKRTMRWLYVLSTLMLVVAVGCGGGDENEGGIGAVCNMAGSTSGCASGNICTNLSGGGNQ